MSLSMSMVRCCRCRCRCRCRWCGAVDVDGAVEGERGSREKGGRGQPAAGTHQVHDPASQAAAVCCLASCRSVAVTKSIVVTVAHVVVVALEKVLHSAHTHDMGNQGDFTSGISDTHCTTLSYDRHAHHNNMMIISPTKLVFIEKLILLRDNRS